MIRYTNIDIQQKMSKLLKKRDEQIFSRINSKELKAIWIVYPRLLFYPALTFLPCLLKNSINCTVSQMNNVIYTETPFTSRIDSLKDSCNDFGILFSVIRTVRGASAMGIGFFVRRRRGDKNQNEHVGWYPLLSSSSKSKQVAHTEWDMRKSS